MRGLLVVYQAVVALAVLLAVAPAQAATVWVEGGESQSLAIACPGGTSASNVAIGTASPRSGSATINVSGVASSTPGRCTLRAAGQNLTGTLYLFGALRFDFSTTCSGLGYTPILDFGEVTLEHACIDGTNAPLLRVREGGNDVGSGSGFLSEDTTYPFYLKVVTGSGTASVEWKISLNGTTWTDAGSATGLTIANVGQAIFLYPDVTGTTTGTYTFILDDFLILSGGSAPPVATRVNFRAPAGAGTYNGWTKTGGSGTIQSVWTSRLNPSTGSCPATVYARSGNTTNLEQTATFSAWDSGTPTPAASSTSTFYGCKWDLYAGRCDGGTNRSYATRRRFAGSNSDTTITPANASYTLYSSVFDITGADSAAQLSNLNGMELGALKSTATSGAVMDVLDEWVQCAWSDAATVSLLQWTQDR